MLHFGPDARSLGIGYPTTPALLRIEQTPGDVTTLTPVADYQAIVGDGAGA